MLEFGGDQQLKPTGFKSRQLFINRQNCTLYSVQIDIYQTNYVDM